MKIMSDPVREFLQDKGCGEHVISGGLAGLIESWEQIVATIAMGYKLGLDDYLNDVDTRQLLSEAMAFASASELQQYETRVEEADTEVKAYLQSADECLWGDEVAEEEGWTRKKNWWYFTYPNNAGEDLYAELGIE